ncbi:glycoside hydrolase family 9 protein [Arcicella rigui]|uniref:Endoglucanase n=1 Tax=Arcicella rigui TaxID=797020 RepID=A0ABU5QCA2_9BACT|nr:glycoside hydrolase family 9 protein [Arcicella rigui]MEA5140455.1 glycoside hydrolase family 9 protein [Arcicella rigui]
MKIKHIFGLGFCLSIINTCALNAQKISEDIRLNQVGFYPNAPKLAVIVNAKAQTFLVKTADSKTTVLIGKLSKPRNSEFSEKTTQIADFSSFNQTGKYLVEVPDLGVSYPFEISEKVHDAAAKASLKAFYYQRVSTEIPEKFAGKWARPFAHPDDKVLVHASAVSAERPEGTVISSPKGWYDAGDYNKYIVNSGITMGTLFAMYEDFPAYFQQQHLNIPESNNAVPDVLDEALWNLRWMLTMQDTDGGVYHKLTNANFDGMIMPKKAKKPRYVVQKGTAATLDFAAVMAQAARIFKQFPNEFPALADSCLTASTRAWEWAIKNPDVHYEQDKMNEKFLPKITTGAYGDSNFSDEWTWAASELYITTQNEKYYETLQIIPAQKMLVPSWNQVRLLGYYSLVRFQKQLTGKAKEDFPALKQSLIAFADTLASGIEKRSFQTLMGKTAKDFVWGSTAVAANQGIAMIQVYQLTKDKKYLTYALTNLDYILGRNGTGYSFLTAFGSKTPMHPHHRLSIADGIVEPLPGFLSGGTNPGQQDKCEGYKTKVADESYLDVDCSYSTNEIAINWNAPMAYLAGAIEALQASILN